MLFDLRGTGRRTTVRIIYLGLALLMGGGLMAVGTRLMGLGLGMSEIQNIARELFRFGRDKIGADQMGKIIAGTPGLSQFA